MAVTCTLSNHFKYQAYDAKINLATDSIKVLLMRSGFVFVKDDHAKKINIKGTITRTDISFVASGNHILTVAGDFVAAGFVVGGKIAASGTSNNNTTFTIVTVAAADMTVTESVTGEGAGSSFTLTGADELATAGGYVQDTKVLTSLVLTEDDTNDRAEMTCANVIWTATSGGIGPTPGAIIYDDTSSDDTIIGYIDFGGEQTAPEGADFTISNLKVRLS